MGRILPDFDSYNLKTLIYQEIKTFFFVYPTTVSLRINSRILSLRFEVSEHYFKFYNSDQLRESQGYRTSQEAYSQSRTV